PLVVGGVAVGEPARRLVGVVRVEVVHPQDGGPVGTPAELGDGGVGGEVGAALGGLLDPLLQAGGLVPELGKHQILLGDTIVGRSLGGGSVVQRRGGVGRDVLVDVEAALELAVLRVQAHPAIQRRSGVAGPAQRGRERVQGARELVHHVHAYAA